jgi:Mg2+ and Co2+ transporter CorA
MRLLYETCRTHLLVMKYIRMEEQRERCKMFMSYCIIYFESLTKTSFQYPYVTMGNLYNHFKEGVITVKQRHIQIGLCSYFSVVSF